jgi:uncharacterized protein
LSALAEIKFDPTLMSIIYKHYRLGPNSLHGPDHWLRVGVIGLALAERTGANMRVVRYFAQLHDVGRSDEGSDIFHGIESAHFCKEHRHLISLDDDEFELLLQAIAKHPMGGLSKNVTTGSCWDADRLDLGRVGIPPDKKYLSTTAAKEDKFFNWASKLHENPML